MKKKLILMLIMLFLGISKVYALEIPVNSYVIGEYLFTRDGSDEYNGVLETKYIMMASKSISSEELEDMIIYFKIADNKYIDGATGEEVEPTFSEEDIKYYNMKKLPELKIYSKFNGEFGNYHTIGTIESEYNDLSLKYDYYGIKNYNGFIYDPEEINDIISSCNGDSCPKLLKTSETGDYTLNFDDETGSYTVFVYPYFELKTLTEETKKVYLNVSEENNAITIKNDLVLNMVKENGIIKANVTDKNNTKYNIEGAYLYLENTSTYEQYFDMFDLTTLLDRLNTMRGNDDIENTKDDYNLYPYKFFEAKKSVSRKYRMPDLELIGATVSPESTDVEIYDMSLTDDDNLAYIGYAVVSDKNGNTYFVDNYKYTPSVGKATPLPSSLDKIPSNGYILLTEIEFEAR